jgi:hypothetical protein
MAYKRWTDAEWDYLLYCFYNSPDLEEAMEKFSGMFGDRKKNSALSKLKRENVVLEEFLGMGLDSRRISKDRILEELKRVYRTLGRPFGRKQFDELSGLSGTGSLAAAGTFGSWGEALDRAGLSSRFAAHAGLEEEIKGYDPEQELKRNWREQKKRLLERAEQRKVKWLRTQAQKLDVVNEMISEAVAKADPPVVEVVRKRPGRSPSQPLEPCTLWFEFSDLQLGTLITSEEMGGINRHDWVVWQEKLGVWKREVAGKIARCREQHRIDRIVIACLGDMVEGQDIFKGQTWQVDRHVVDQAIYGANDTAAAFAEIMMSHPDLKFEVLEVFGNHGRIGKKGSAPYACSMDKVYQRMLESQLGRVRGLDNCSYHKNEAWFYFVELYGWNHLLLHGDQGMSKLWSSMPTVNSLEKGLVRYNQMLQQQVHFLHCGHFHNPVNWAFNVSQILINGSFIGTSTFSASKMVASGPAVQLMYVFTPRTGLDATHRLYLTENVMKPIEPRTLQ